jgi:IS5 family transposase
MAWKNLKQLSLADSLTSDHEALTELDDINELMDWEAIEHLLGDIHTKRRGNSAWPLCLCSRCYYCRAGIA